MPEWTLLGRPGADRPHALTNDFGKRVEAPRDPSEPPPDRAREIPLARFPDIPEVDAVTQFQELVKHGFRDAAPLYMTRREKLWRHRGGPHYLNQQVFRLRVPQITVDKSKGNQELYRITTLLNQLTERYHKARKEGSVAILPGMDLPCVRATLAEASKDRARLHCLAAAADVMLEEAYAAFGLEQPAREYWVHSIYDEQAAEKLAAITPSPAPESPPVPDDKPDVIPMQAAKSAPLAHHSNRSKHAGVKS